uniref:ARF like GTPase 6 interacting protein 6 n=1 Tax=Erpetoichthys calabaricus TaxID=27687 RepID=A0A8C4S6P6_ERPCA
MNRSMKRITAQIVESSDGVAQPYDKDFAEIIRGSTLRVTSAANQSSPIHIRSRGSTYQRTFLSSNCKSVKWPTRIFSMMCCILILCVIAFILAFLYVILKDLRSEKERGEDGTEINILGFWGLLVLSLTAGLTCCSFSWTLTYFDSFEPGMFPPTPLSPSRFNIEKPPLKCNRANGTPPLPALPV